MEAYGAVNNNNVDTSISDADRRRIRTVKPDGQPDTTRSDTGMEKRLRQLESDLASQRREIRQLNSDAEQWKQRAVAAEQVIQHQTSAYQSPPINYSGSSPEVFQTASPPTVAFPQPYFQGPAGSSPVNYQPVQPSSQRGGGRGRRGHGRRRSDTADRDACFNCGQHGHWRAVCPNAAVASSSQHSNVAGVHHSGVAIGSETYINAKLECGQKKRELTCLLDSGCDQNILPKRLAKKVKINTADE